MNKQTFDLVILSMSTYWEWKIRGLSNRNLQILENLRQRPEINKILTIDFLPFTFKRSLRIILKDRKVKLPPFKSKVKGIFQIDKNYYVWSTVLSYLNETRFLQELKILLQDLNFENWILWSYNPMFVQCFNLIEPKLKIFDTVDDWRYHPNYQRYQKRLTQNYQLIDQKSDIIFTVAKDLKNIYQQQKKVHWIPNGVDIDHFQRLDNINIQNQAKRIFQNIKKPIIGYAGIIQERIDFNLIEYLLEKNPNLSFVFLGWVWKGVQKKVENLKSLSRVRTEGLKFKNIYFLGQIKYQDYPYYLNLFDIGIVPHKIDKFTASMNPMKFYEYLAVGLPIISTKVAGTEIFQNQIEVAENKEQFNKKLNFLVCNLKEQKSNKIKKQEFVKEFSWGNRVEEMINKLKIQN